MEDDSKHRRLRKNDDTNLLEEVLSYSKWRQPVKIIIIIG